MVSRNGSHTVQQELLHSSGASSNSSGSTTLTTAIVEPNSIDNNQHTTVILGVDKQQSSSSSTMQLLRRSRNAMKLSNLFHRSGKSNANSDPTQNEGIIDTTTKTTIPNDTNDVVTEKRDVATTTANTKIRVSSLYQGEISEQPSPSLLFSLSSTTPSTSAIVIHDNDVVVTKALVNHDHKSNNSDKICNEDIAAEFDQVNEICNELIESSSPEQQSTTPPKSSLQDNIATGTFCAASSTSTSVPFFDRMCAINRTASDDSAVLQQQQQQQQQEKHHAFHNTLPDDPSIQESIECIIMAAQQQQQDNSTRFTSSALKEEQCLRLSENNSDSNSSEQEWYKNHHSQQQQLHQRPPSTIHQSLLKNRSLSRLPMQFQQDVISRSPRTSSLPLSSSSSPPSNYSNSNHINRIPPTYLFDETSIEVSHDDKETILIPSIQQPESTIPEEEPSSICKKSEPPKAATVCSCCQHHVPLLSPDAWPQRPLLLRPTPNGGTRIKGIRFVSSTEKDYLWEAPKAQSSSTSIANGNPSEAVAATTTDVTWPQALRERWKRDTDISNIPPLSPRLVKSTGENNKMCCKCMILPINNGKELPGESLVSDFESDLFIGTILVRLKDCQGTTIPKHREVSTGGYFHNLHRRYQVVIRGQFKQRISWTECIAGFQLERPCGKLPPKWIVNGALNVVRFFAPQLQTNVTGPRPYSLTPLGSTPQSLILHDLDSSTDDSNLNTSITSRLKCDITMEVPQQEPLDDKNTLIGHASTASSSMQRARHRKKHFDKMYSDAHHHHGHSNSKSFKNTDTLYTDLTKIYTFEFLQHLLSFDDFTIELGSIVGSVPLQNVLNGQPLQIMSSCGSPVPLSSKESTNSVTPTTNSNSTSSLLQNRLWCFDIWHEMLYNDAKAYDDTIQANNGEVPPDLQQQCNNSSSDEDGNVFCPASPT